MKIKLYSHQEKVLDKLKTGSILCGGVGSGKSITALAYYFTRECGGKIPDSVSDDFKEMTNPKDLYIITTARKRDTLEWDKECANFMLSRERDASINNVKVTIDSWNNIKKYLDVEDSFFIFDEQRLVGSGAWVKTFLKIVKKNNWILLSATPGDTWMDYIPVFIANGFYKHRTDFIRRHVVYNNFTPYPKVERYLDTSILERHRRNIIVDMPFERHTKRHNKLVRVEYDKEKSDRVMKQRWNVYKEEPIQGISELCYTLRRVTNEHPSRSEAVIDILEKRKKAIIFYNFDYELMILRDLMETNDILYTEWNGHKHEPIPEGEEWAYLVQYTAGAEGWNCVTTNTVIFYSQNYSYKTMEQAQGRIDRLNTPYIDLYYYHLVSKSQMDAAIRNSLRKKQNFNESTFVRG